MSLDSIGIVTSNHVFGYVFLKLQDLFSYTPNEGISDFHHTVCADCCATGQQRNLSCCIMFLEMCFETQRFAVLDFTNPVNAMVRPISACCPLATNHSYILGMILFFFALQCQTRAANDGAKQYIIVVGYAPANKSNGSYNEGPKHAKMHGFNTAMILAEFLSLGEQYLNAQQIISAANCLLAKKESMSVVPLAPPLRRRTGIAVNGHVCQNC